MSDFLKKLREATNGGPKNEAIAGGFNEILKRADEIASDSDLLKKAQDNAEKKRKEQKALTPEEMEILQAQSVAETKRMALIEAELFERAKKMLVAQDEKVEDELKQIKAAGGLVGDEVERILQLKSVPQKTIDHFSDDELKVEIERRRALRESEDRDIDNSIKIRNVNLDDINKIREDDDLV